MESNQGTGSWLRSDEKLAVKLHESIKITVQSALLQDLRTQERGNRPWQGGTVHCSVIFQPVVVVF